MSLASNPATLVFHTSRMLGLVHFRSATRSLSGLSVFVLRLQYRWSPIVPKFEDCLQQLEKIVEQLEKGDLPLEKSLQLFEEGVRLSNSCRQELEAAEGKVEILMKQGGKLQAEPFEAGKQAAGDSQ